MPRLINKVLSEEGLATTAGRRNQKNKKKQKKEEDEGGVENEFTKYLQSTITNWYVYMLSL